MAVLVEETGGEEFNNSGTDNSLELLIKEVDKEGDYLMFDIWISGLFLLIWLAIFCGILYLFQRFVPKGFIIAQILFAYIWILLPYYDVQYIGFLHYDNIPIFWIVASLILLFSINKKA